MTDLAEKIAEALWQEHKESIAEGPDNQALFDETAKVIRRVLKEQETKAILLRSGKMETVVGAEHEGKNWGTWDRYRLIDGGPDG